MSDEGSVAVEETHISVVFFIGDRVYKLKKPVRYEFVDLTSRAERERICHKEIQLNRRLAPDVYLRVLDVVDEEGQPVDHLVEMRRMPQARRLSALIGAPGDTDACLRRLARLLADFHTSADTSPEITAWGDWSAVGRDWRDNFEEMENFVGSILDDEVMSRVTHEAQRYLEGRRRLFDERSAAGRVRDGHGDLLADDIFCLSDGPRVLDCVEFSDRFRCSDVVADVTFLAMDLERLGAPEAARRFLDWYREFSGDDFAPSLAHHYIAYRAVVRSKVACLKHAQGDAASRPVAGGLLRLADRHLEEARVRMVVIGGLPGTGKSTLARGISAETGWPVLRSDEIRLELTKGRGDSHVGRQAGFREGIYSPGTTDGIYREMLSRARDLIEKGTSVVLDASWIDAGHRGEAASIAHEAATDLIQLHCVLPGDVAERRLRARASERKDVSEADAEIARAMAADLDPWPEAAEIPTQDEPDTVLSRAMSFVTRDRGVGD